MLITRCLASQQWFSCKKKKCSSSLALLTCRLEPIIHGATTEGHQVRGENIFPFDLSNVDKEKNNCILATGTVVVVIYNNKFWILPYVLKIVFRYL